MSQTRTRPASLSDATLSPRELFDRCARGRDPLAWTTFVERYSSAITVGVRKALRSPRQGFPDPSHLEDLRQECYCHLLAHGCRRLRGFRGTTDAEALRWLARLAARLTRDKLRVALAAKRGGRLATLPFPKSAPSLSPAAASPERTLIARDRLRAYLRSWRELTASDQEVRILRMVYLYGCSTQEVVRALGGRVTPNAIDSFLHRFRRRLRARNLPAPVRAGARRPSAHSALAA
jgi:hypothetical protein